MDYQNLSRTVSHALRHEPWLYELELDDAGWVPLTALLAALRVERREWRDLGLADLLEMIARSEKKRHEIDGDRIRAFYGHSLPGKLSKQQSAPPAWLYHGTSPEVAELIQREGLRPMGRQYVHLSVDTATAMQVGGRKAAAPVLLKVDATAAYAAGAAFYHGNEMVWLADEVPAEFIMLQAK
ncbi:RNA 2'-phosphotransferase [Chromobacterium sp. LK1]|uniref:RNA 2'-phosphotransferase n=1 Tax=Chromobacterium sp. LK1 TaxID=1628193 RepID=UPI000654BB82|nr:RNA 2'-phosphotransferase [Chromobacterium sp. LK1]KMN29945.1 RNA 2'-phosphotransferase [Chromobacterium sp. LK1]